MRNAKLGGGCMQIVKGTLNGMASCSGAWGFPQNFFEFEGRKSGADTPGGGPSGWEVPQLIEGPLL